MVQSRLVSFAAAYYGEPQLATSPRAVALAFDTVVAAIIPLVSALNAIVSPIASAIDIQRLKHAIFAILPIGDIEQNW